MKKILSFALAICLLVTMLCGCDILEELNGPSMSELWHELTHEVTDIYKETLEIIREGIKRWDALTFNSYEKAMKKEWETVLTSEYGNETLKVMRRHDKILPQYWYMVTLEQDGVCTYYIPPNFEVCPNITLFFWCNDEHATLKTAANDNEMLQVIYPYLQDVLACQILLHLERNELTVSEVQDMAKAQLIDPLVSASVDGVIEGAAGSAFGVIVQPNLFVSELNELAGLVSTGVDVSENTDSATNPGYHYDPILTALVEGFWAAAGLVDIANLSNVDALNELSGKATNWTDLVALDTLSPEGRKLNFRVTDTHLQWQYKGDEEWNDLQAIDDLPNDGRRVIFQVTGTHVQWRTWSDTEIYLSKLQARLHEVFKATAYYIG